LPRSNRPTDLFDDSFGVGKPLFGLGLPSDGSLVEAAAQFLCPHTAQSRWEANIATGMLSFGGSLSSAGGLTFAGGTPSVTVLNCHSGAKRRQSDPTIARLQVLQHGYKEDENRKTSDKSSVNESTLKDNEASVVSILQGSNMIYLVHSTDILALLALIVLLVLLEELVPPSSCH
jgi:hypothetical protein